MATKLWSPLTDIGTSGTTPSLARYKAVWAEFHNAMVEVGFTWVSGCAGQVDIDTVAATPAVQALTHWRVYEINDAFSATLPIYIKVQFQLVHNYGQYLNTYTQAGTTLDLVTGEIGGLATEARPSFLSAVSNVYGRSYSAPCAFSRSDGFAGLVFNMSGVGFANVVATLNKPSIAIFIERATDDSGNFTPDGFSMFSGPADGLTAANPKMYSRHFTTLPSDSGWVFCSKRAGGLGAINSSSGAIQFARINKLSPGLVPTQGLLTYYYQQIPQLTSFTLSGADGFPRKYLALGYSTKTTHTDGQNIGFMPDYNINLLCVAMLWE